MAYNDSQWCVLKMRLQRGGERFEVGERFRVAWREDRGTRVSLTLDGNGESEHWTSRRVLHDVSVDEVTFI